MLRALINTTTAGVAGGARAVLDALLPPQCPITGQAVSGPGVLSAEGWSQIRFIDDPVCAGCGAPFAFDHGAGAMCGACLADKHSFDSARAAILYDDAGRRLVSSFKYSDRTEFAPMFGKWLARAGTPLVSKQSILIPVPLHTRRLAARRYNQAALIAKFAINSLNCRYEPLALVRTRPTPPQQQQLSETARKRNVAGAFEVREDMKELVRDAHIIVVDDVLTTGATVSACARALKKAGAMRVDALVLARVVRGGADAI